jgi:hypothetical protein
VSRESGKLSSHETHTIGKMRSKESIAGIRGPTAPQLAREEHRSGQLRGDTSRIGRQIGPRKKTHAGPLKTKRVKDPSR